MALKVRVLPRFALGLLAVAPVAAVRVGNNFQISVPVFSTSTAGVVPESPGGTTSFLRADGTWAAPTLTPGGASLTVQYNNAGVLGGMSGTSWDDVNRSLTITGATVTVSEPILDLAQTWNAGGVTFTALKLNVTSTASAAASLLMDLQVAAASKFNVDKVGNVVVPGTSSIGSPGCTIQFDATTAMGINNGTNGLSINAGGVLTFNTSGLSDLKLQRDAADTLAQRRGTNAQVLRWYKTFTDSSNYERGALQTGTTFVELASETAGTGADDVTIRLSAAGAGQIHLIGGGGSPRILATGASAPTFTFQPAGAAAEPQLQMATNTGVPAPGFGFVRFTNGTTPARCCFGKSRGTTIGDFTIVQSGDELGAILFDGADNTNFAGGAGIHAIVDGTPGANDMPARVEVRTSPDGTEVPVVALKVDSLQAVLAVSATGGLGYGTGAGGTVTQITSLVTGVTLNKVVGQVVTVSATTAAGAEETFTVTDSAVAANDGVLVWIKSTSSAGTPQVVCSAVAAGSFNITVNNLHASAALNNTLTIGFAVIKGVIA
jgi:hypothetical protein